MRQRPPSPPNYIDKFFDPPQLPPTPPPSPPPPSPPPPFYPGVDGGNQFPFDNFPPPPSFSQSPPPPPPPPRSRKENYFPYTTRMPPKKGDYSDDDNNNLEYDTNNTNFFRPVKNHRITLDENLQDIFPDADHVFEADPHEARENVKYEDFSTTLEKGEIPRELEFFQGERNENFRQNLNSLGLS